MPLVPLVPLVPLAPLVPLVRPAIENTRKGALSYIHVDLFLAHEETKPFASALSLKKYGASLEASTEANTESSTETSFTL